MKKLKIAIVLTVIALSVEAQNVKQDTVSLNRVLTLEKEYNPVLRDVSKINQLPDLKEPESPKSKVEFSDYTIPYTLAPYLRPTKPDSYLTELIKFRKKGYLNIGLSSLLDVNGDAGYQLVNTGKDFLSIYASHNSSRSNVTYLENSKSQEMKIGDTYGGLNFCHQFEKVNFNAGAKYTFSSYNYYGMTILPPSNSSIPQTDEEQEPANIDKNKEQENNLFIAHAGVASRFEDGLSFKVNACYSYYQQKYGYATDIEGRNENRFVSDLDFHAHSSSMTSVGIAGGVKSYRYNVHAVPLYGSILTDTVNKRMGIYHYVTLSGNPYIYFEDTNWNLRLGVSGSWQLGGLNTFVIAPDVRFVWNPDKALSFYLLAGGGISDNSNYNSFYENRYLDPSYRLHDSNSPLDILSGFDVTVAPTFNIGLFAGYKLVNNEHFYIAAPNLYDTVSNRMLLSGQRVLPVYAKAQAIKAGGYIRYAYQDIWDVRLKATYYHWNIKNAPYELNFDLYKDIREWTAWNKPQFETELNIVWQVPVLPLHIDLSYRAELGRKAFIDTPEYQSIKMKDIHDLSVRGIYSINPTFSVYAAVNNFLYQKYDFWIGYPAQSFNIAGGISIKF
ncbi:MAG: hypothetical protein LBH32_08175 [Dysgonamonadaceae bacterium]|jgi:hypothetical protein|nr:hypothetical protein [Dysgonamonadaceae bacterium]